ncbi:hypothetical protein RJ639_017484 [Escallonia herrerae]|uniref:VQ domain-containing protein n=1 Tax=Escallonia herrerae TaxID=1293975 RepID=A0AA89ALQ6_9ASTE|nr:hypothetical protein RJ639_017484 [Escallonia herrerae]
MESYSYAYSSSSFSYPREERKPFVSSLHSVRRSTPVKIMKKPIAPLPPTPPKIYQVDSINFKAVVQKLTGVPEFQTRRLQEVAPPPLNISTPFSSDYCGTNSEPRQFLPSPPLSATFRHLMNETLETHASSKLSESLGVPNSLGFTLSPKRSESWGALSPLGFTLSPASLSWCSFAFLSPGTVSSMGQSTKHASSKSQRDSCSIDKITATKDTTISKGIAQMVGCHD